MGRSNSNTSTIVKWAEFFSFCCQHNNKKSSADQISSIHVELGTVRRRNIIRKPIWSKHPVKGRKNAFKGQYWREMENILIRKSMCRSLQWTHAPIKAHTTHHLVVNHKPVISARLCPMPARNRFWVTKQADKRQTAEHWPVQTVSIQKNRQHSIQIPRKTAQLHIYGQRPW